MKSNNSVRAERAFRTVAVVMGAMGFGGPVGAAAPATVPQFDFNISGGDIVARLQEFAAITATQMLYDSNLPMTTQGVHGLHSAEDALIILLRNTGLLCEYVHSGLIISVRRSPDHRALQRCLNPQPRVPYEEVGPTSPPRRDLEEVDVYGSGAGTHLHGIPEIGSPLLKLNEKEIRDSGAHDVPDLLQITQNFEGGPTQDTHYGAPEAIANSGFGTGANLRGLGSRSTMVLLNGRPIAPSGSDASFTDLLQFPVSIIKEIEVLPDGASAIYGSEAVGGVVNIKTFDDYTGPETHLEIGSVTDGHQEQHRFSQSGGARWDRGNILVVGEVMHWGSLPADERWQANSDLAPLGPNGNVRYGNPGNLETTQGTYPIPLSQSGRPLDFSTLTPGAPRLTDPEAGADIVPNQTRWSLYTSLHQKLTPFMTLWSDILWTERYAEEHWGGQEVNLNVTNSPFLLHPPPGQITEEYNLFDDFGSRLSAVNVRTLNAALGLQVKLPGAWHLVLSGSDALETETQLSTGQADVTALQAAVSNSTPALAFNPLGSGSNTSASVLASVAETQWFGSRSQLWSYEVIADGPFLSLGAGAIHEALGIEYRDQRFVSAISQPATGSDLRRQLYAGFAEVEAPLLGAETRPAPFRDLTVSLAGRIEHYSDFGRSAAPRAGLKWAPVKHLEFHGTWGRSIRAADLGDLSQKSNISVAGMLNGTQTLIWNGGNPALTVERALTRTLGLTFESDESSSLHFTGDVSYFDILYKARIQQGTLEPIILDDPLYASFVTHHPSTSLQQKVCNNSSFFNGPASGSRQDCLQLPVGALVDLRFHNAATLWTDGIDARIGASFESPVGTMGLKISGTYILDYQQANTPGAPLMSVLNSESHPLALRLMGTLTWEWGPARALINLHYDNHYRDTETVPITRVASWTTTDLRLVYTFGAEDLPNRHPIDLAFYCKNLFNRYPPFSTDALANVGYDQENGDVTGRTCTLALHIKW